LDEEERSIGAGDATAPLRDTQRSRALAAALGRRALRAHVTALRALIDGID
jgi:hypothetical protein